jgi:hypothetical protein
MYTKLSSVIVRRHIVKIAGDYFGDPVTQMQAHMHDTTLRKADHEGKAWRGVKEKDLDEVNYYSDKMNQGQARAITILNEATGGKFLPLRVMSEGVDAINDIREAHPEYDAENIYFTNKARREKEEAEEWERISKQYKDRVKATTSVGDTASNIPTKDIKKLLANHVEHGATNPGALGLLGTGILGLAGHRKLTRGRVF